jgi:hypothetical protein
VDANAVIQGVPPVRSSNATIELIPNSSGSEISFTEPTEEAKSYRDDSGAFGQHLYCVHFLWSSPHNCFELLDLHRSGLLPVHRVMMGVVVVHLAILKNSIRTARTVCESEQHA